MQNSSSHCPYSLCPYTFDPISPSHSYLLSHWLPLFLSGIWGDWTEFYNSAIRNISLGDSDLDGVKRCSLNILPFHDCVYFALKTQPCAMFSSAPGSRGHWVSRGLMKAWKSIRTSSAYKHWTALAGWATCFLKVQNLLCFCHLSGLSINNVKTNKLCQYEM